MQTGTTDAVEAGIGTTEEPPTRNVRVARWGVAGGLIALVMYLLLTMYAAMSGWPNLEPVAFGRGMLTLAMVVGFGFALWGYGNERADRKVAAARAQRDRADSDRMIWERDRFDELAMAEAALAAGLRDLGRVVDDGARQVRELRALVAQVEMSRGRGRRRSRRRRDQPRAEGNLIRLDPRTVRAARNLARRVAGEDNREDKS